jgi:DNA polymerase II small subunit
LYKDFAKPIWDLPNVVLVSNPAFVNIGATEEFSGFDVLLYHGYSFDYYMANVESIRNNGGYDRADLMMKFLFQKRHLAPTHTSTLYIPDTKTDPLVINRVPDFFLTGHIHKTAVANYRGITMICGSCWQSKTSFQEKVGHHPEPSRVPIINLQTRDVKILKFGK